MPDPHETLSVFAEVSVALAGFSGIAIPFEFIAQDRAKNLPKMTLSKFNINTVNWTLSLGTDLLLAAILINAVGAWSEAAYLVALFVQLTLAGILFVKFASDTFAHPVN
ncbi:MAG: hypothetical protein ACI88G_001508 [Woeseiaceae bacterium]|jgi:hypothetical protein